MVGMELTLVTIHHSSHGLKSLMSVIPQLMQPALNLNQLTQQLMKHATQPLTPPANLPQLYEVEV